MALGVSTRHDFSSLSVHRERGSLASGESGSVPEFIGVSDWAARMREAILTHARHIRPVFICGEEGTGKSHVAQLIHSLSSRRNNPFQSINCRDVSDSALVSALFGEVRRFRDGSTHMTPGAIARANGGTIYLRYFSKSGNAVIEAIRQLLLRDSYRMRGSEVEEPADIRLVIDCSNFQGLSGPAQDFYREVETLGDRIELIPLRNRQEDIVPLTQYFLRIFCERDGREVRRLSEEAELALTQYHWPGNVAALRRGVEHMVSHLQPALVSLGMVLESIRIVVPPSSALRLGSSVKLSHLLSSTERQIICEALRMSGGKQNRAAKLLGISKSTLCTKISKLEIDPKEYSGTAS